MAVCSALKRDGSPCTLQATEKDRLCWAHSPQHAEQRRRRASKGGRSKANTEIRDLKAQLEDLSDGVLEKRIDRSDAIAVNMIINTRARLIELERKIKETEELEQRISAIEQRQSFGLGQHKGGRKIW